MLNEKLFCARLKQARKATGMTQCDVADELNTTGSLIVKYEKGYYFPGIRKVVELAELYGVSIDWLCGMDGGKANEG